MPRRGGRHYVLVQGAEEAMTAFKYEVTEDLGLAHKVSADGGFRDMTTTEVGTIGGEMVRRIQAAGEWTIKKRYEANEDRLMPREVMPEPGRIRDVSNQGKPQPEYSSIQ